MKLTFGKDTNQEYTVNFNSGFRLLEIPKNMDNKGKEILFQNTPSVIGTNILLPYFKLYVDKKKVELTTV